MFEVIVFCVVIGLVLEYMDRRDQKQERAKKEQEKDKKADEALRETLRKMDEQRNRWCLCPKGRISPRAIGCLCGKCGGIITSIK